MGLRRNCTSFLTPDPAGNLVASPADPQSWNQYADVRNSPATLVDPFGLFGTDPALCSTSAGMAYCPGTSITVNGGDGAIIDTVPIPVPLGAVIGAVGTHPAPSSGSSGGGGGYSRKNISQADNACLDNFYSSRMGKWVNFASPFSIFWGPNRTEAGMELIGGGGTKAAAVYSSVQAGKTSLITLSGEVSIASKLDSIISVVGSKIESAVASVPATLPIIAAMSMDLRVHASCYANAVDPGAIERVQSNPEILLVQ